MAKRGGGPRKPPRGAGGAQRAGGAGRPGVSQRAGRPQRPTPSAKRPRESGGADAASPVPEGPFRLGAIPGATPGKWIDIWHERMPDVELVLTPLSVADQRRALAEGEVDAALVRLPIADDEGLHVIALYEEVPVVVASKDSHLTAADELDLADLSGEVIIVPRDDVLAVDVPGGIRPSFDPPDDTEQAIATAATGVGIVIVPMSLARLHHRKDTEYRPLREGPPSPVGLAWPTEGTTPLVETFIGIVRGRTANSSRT